MIHWKHTYESIASLKCEIKTIVCVSNSINRKEDVWNVRRNYVFFGEDMIVERGFWLLVKDSTRRLRWSNLGFSNFPNTTHGTGLNLRPTIPEWVITWRMVHCVYRNLMHQSLWKNFMAQLGTLLFIRWYLNIKSSYFSLLAGTSHELMTKKSAK